jgi:hypothetical protein
MRGVNIIQGQTNIVGGLEVTYKAPAVENPTITTLAFWNAGRETIDSSDIPPAAPLVYVLVGLLLLKRSIPKQFEAIEEIL